MKYFVKRDLRTKLYGLDRVIWLEGNDLFMQRPLAGNRIPSRLPLDAIVSIEVSTKSVVPTFTVCCLAGIAFFSIWGFIGAWQNILELKPLVQSIMLALAFTSMVGAAAGLVRMVFATLRIRAMDSTQHVARFVPRKAAQSFARHASKRPH